MSNDKGSGGWLSRLGFGESSKPTSESGKLNDARARLDLARLDLVRAEDALLKADKRLSECKAAYLQSKKREADGQGSAVELRILYNRAETAREERHEAELAFEAAQATSRSLARLVANLSAGTAAPHAPDLSEQEEAQTRRRIAELEREELTEQESLRAPLNPGVERPIDDSWIVSGTDRADEPQRGRPHKVRASEKNALIDP